LAILGWNYPPVNDVIGELPPRDEQTEPLHHAKRKSLTGTHHEYPVASGKRALLD
jgi:hypothetical protein